MSIYAAYTLEIDWDGDGDFADSGEDVTADLLFPASIDRKFSNPLARMASTGRATFVLDNQLQNYSPPLQANVLPRRAVKFSMTYDGATLVLFRGFLESIRPTSGQYRERRVTLECVDALDVLSREEGEIALQEDVWADDVIDAVISAVYTPPSTDYDQGVNLFPISADRWNDERGYQAGARAEETIAATSKILDAATSDWGHFFIAGNGAPTYRNRVYELEATTALTLSGQTTGLDYNKSVGSVYNHVAVTCHPRAVGEVPEVLGRISQQDAPAIEASDGATFEIRFRDSVTGDRLGGKDCLTPVKGTDLETTADPAGSGGSENGNISVSATFYGTRAEVTVENSAAYAVYVQKLQVRGLAVRTREQVTMVAEDAASQAAYEKRKFRVNAPLLAYQSAAQRLATHLVARYKDPQDDVRGVRFVANYNATLMAAARDLDLLDRVVLSETQTGLSSFNGLIYALKHTIHNRYHHEVTMSLKEIYDPGTPFRLGDTMDSGHILIY